MNAIDPAFRTSASLAGTRAAVIGAGFGGLALAIRLQSEGIETTLYEARDKLGGRAYVYRDEGFVFDAGPTVITDPDCLAQLWRLSGREMADYIELVPVDPFYRLCWEDGTVFDYNNDQDALDEQIRRINPKDVDGYRRFLAYSKRVYHEGYEKLGTTAFLNFGQMVRAAPALLATNAYRSVYAKVSQFIEDEHLRTAFSFQPLLVGGNPFDASSIYALIHALEREGGVWFARGGTGELVAAMGRLFEDLGGTILLDHPAEDIAVENGRATGVVSRGETRRFDMVASNADVMHTYKSLLGKTQRGRKKARQLDRMRFSMSLFVIYFGLSSKREDLKHHMVLFGPRYRELVEDIFKGQDLPDDFSLYLHAPSVTDETMAPEGSSAYYVLSPVPHLGRADIDWEVEGPRYRDRILDYLEERYIPDLKRDLVTSRIFTPLDFRDRLNAHHGSAFSVEPILTQSAWFRPHNRDDVIRNMYIVGAGTHPGAGVPGVVGTAKATAALMIEQARREA